MNKLIKRVFGSTKPREIFVDLLTFERLLTKPVIHLIYWSGLLILVMMTFGVIGGTIGIAMKEDAPWGWFLAFPFLVGGLLTVCAGALMWRAFCEFYVAIFRIAEDLHILRLEAEAPPQEKAESPVSTASEDLSSEPDVLEDPFFSKRLNKSVANETPLGEAEADSTDSSRL